MKSLFIIGLFAIVKIAFAIETASEWKIKPVSLVKVGLLDLSENVVQFQNIRYQADVVKVGSPLSGFFQIEGMNCWKENANWFRLLWLNYKSSGFEVRVGRIFQAAPYYTTPTPSALRYAKFPRDPWTYYAYGVQAEKAWDSGWSAIADVTAQAGLSFSDKRNFDRMETSGRIARKFGSSQAGFACMVRPDSTLVHVEGKMLVNQISISGVAHATFNKGEDITGVFVNLEREVWNGLFVHGRTDLRGSSKKGNSGSIHTGGLMFETCAKKLRLILDYERHNGLKTDSVYGIVQYKL